MAPVLSPYRIAYQRQLDAPWPGVELTTKDAAMRLADDLSYCVGDTLVVMCGGVPIAKFEPKEEA